jgi:5'-nucleotidase
MDAESLCTTPSVTGTFRSDIALLSDVGSSGAYHVAATNRSFLSSFKAEEAAYSNAVLEQYEGTVRQVIGGDRVVTVDARTWNRKVRAAAEAGRKKLFFVLDFDRTITACFLDDGTRSMDCHDILASIPKVTEQCKQQMHDMMNHYYPIEIHPTMSNDDKIPHMIEWYTKVNELLLEQHLTRDDVAEAVRLAREKKKFRLRDGVEEVFQIAHERGIPIIILSAGLGNIIEEVVRQCIWEAKDMSGFPYDSVRVLSNTLLWDEEGNHREFSSPMIHMYNKSLSDAPSDLKKFIAGRNFGLLCGDGLGDLTMASGHETKEVLKFGFLNEKVKERYPNYVQPGAYDRLVVKDGTFEPILEVVREVTAEISPLVRRHTTE